MNHLTDKGGGSIAKERSKSKPMCCTCRSRVFHIILVDLGIPRSSNNFSPLAELRFASGSSCLSGVRHSPHHAGNLFQKRVSQKPSGLPFLRNAHSRQSKRGTMVRYEAPQLLCCLHTTRASIQPIAILPEARAQIRW